MHMSSMMSSLNSTLVRFNLMPDPSKDALNYPSDLPGLLIWGSSRPYPVFLSADCETGHFLPIQAYGTNEPTLFEPLKEQAHHQPAHQDQAALRRALTVNSSLNRLENTPHSRQIQIVTSQL